MFICTLFVSFLLFPHISIVSQFTSAWYFFPQVDLNMLLYAKESRSPHLEMMHPKDRLLVKNNLTMETLNLLLPEHMERLSEKEISNILSLHMRYQLFNSQSFTLGWENYKKEHKVQKNHQNSAHVQVITTPNLLYMHTNVSHFHDLASSTKKLHG